MSNPSSPPTGAAASARPSLADVAGAFFRIGNSTFGGGYVTIMMLQRELVERRGWLSPPDFDLAFAMSRVTPGTVLLAFCAASGDLMRGVWGAVAALLAMMVPSATIAVFLIYGYETWQTNPVAGAMIGGTVAAVAGMMWSTIWTILRPHLGGALRNLRAIVIAGGAFLASWQFEISPLTIIIAGTVIGALWKGGQTK